MEKTTDRGHEVEVAFKNAKNLGEFILAIQRKEPILGEYFEADRIDIDFPHFMISQLRKMKMASKKGSFKPFGGPAATGGKQGQPVAPQMPAPLQWGQIPGFPLQQGFFAPGPVVGAQGPAQGKGQAQGQGQSGKAAAAQGQTQTTAFSTVEDLLKNKAQFLGLNETARAPILRRLLTAKLGGYPQLLDAKNAAKVESVLGVFLDREIIDPSDLVDALGNEEEFENLLRQAVEY